MMQKSNPALAVDIEDEWSKVCGAPPNLIY